MPQRRYKAPTGNREVLADPPTEQLPALVEANRRSLDRSDVLIGGMPLRELRRLARAEVLKAACEYTFGTSQSPPIAMGGLSPDMPLLLAGHQPELSHPGVWVKNFALNGLAKRVGGIPLNLVVDNDTLKSTSLRFPVRDGRNPSAVRLESVAFDRLDVEQPYEERRVHDLECFCTFAERAELLWKTWGIEPLLPRVWSDVVNDPSETIGGKFASVRRKWEREWGCTNLELPVSRLANTKSFAIFAEWLSHHTPFQVNYNTHVFYYRERHGVRSRHHPVPDLGNNGERYEYPFWVVDRVRGRRGRLFVAMYSQGTRYWVDDHEVNGWDVIAPNLRPRALTLTLFARVCLGDFFIHGIGGGKYDEVTDALIRENIRLAPPAFQVLSATLNLPLPTFPTTPADVAAIARRQRDIFWNPQRHVPGPEAERPEVRDLVQYHHDLEGNEPDNREGRRKRYREFRRVGERLRPQVEGRLAEARDWLDRARQEAAANAVLLRRDFAWVLYPEDVLRPFLQSFLATDEHG